MMAGVWLDLSWYLWGPVGCGCIAGAGSVVIELVKLCDTREGWNLLCWCVMPC